jgi:DNA-binding NarL/FixJ family response regulator
MIQVVDQPIRILIVEAQQFVADALEALLNQQPGMVVVGSLGSIADSGMQTAKLRPDIVILDFRSNDVAAVQAARAIAEARSEAKVIFMTRDETDNVILAAIEAGASAVLYMSTAALQVIDTVRIVAAGGTLIPPNMIATLLHERRRTDSVRGRLTSREREILSLMSEGVSSREIAARLGVSYTTVRSHVRNLAGKLDAHSKLEVLAKAQRLDLVEQQGATRFAFA